MPFYATARYFWHFVYALRGRGKAAEFQREGGSLARASLVCRCAATWNCSRASRKFGASAAG